MANFAEILNKPADEIKEPPPLPVGTYLSIVDGPHTERDFNGTPVIDFKLKILQPMQDVQDMEGFAAAGGPGRPIRHTIWLQSNDGQDTSYQLVRFLEEHLAIEKSGKALREMLAEAPGRQVAVAIKHTVQTKEGQAPKVFANVASTARV